MPVSDLIVGGRERFFNRHGSCGVRMATEVEMRKWYIPLVLLLVGVAWWASPGTAAQEPQQFTTVGFGIGEHVTLSLEPALAFRSPVVQCEVIGGRGQFLGCAPDKGREGPARESWYNLQFVTRIEKAAKH